jgi:hypothetical protein
MNNSINEMRRRLKEGFNGGMKPMEGLDVASVFRPTANDSPRLPQSRIPSPKPAYDKAGRPSEETRKYPEITPIIPKKPRDIWQGWL